jgi:methylenetetrahydrofolate dehydrogenase (NADP+)/methenyltetrahydrofolate cyclohydrolase
MAGKLIDGKAIAEQINAETVAEIGRLKEQHRLTPGLAVVLVGDDPASATYVSMKDKMSARLGLHSERVNLPASTSRGELLAILNDLNFKHEIHGILVQSPLPPQILAEDVFAAVDPSKDVDGFHPLNVGKVAVGDPTGFAPCTPAGVHELLIRSGVRIVANSFAEDTQRQRHGHGLPLAEPESGADLPVSRHFDRGNRSAAFCNR